MNVTLRDLRLDGMCPDFSDSHSKYLHKPWGRRNRIFDIIMTNVRCMRCRLQSFIDEVFEQRRPFEDQTMSYSFCSQSTGIPLGVPVVLFSWQSSLIVWCYSIILEPRSGEDGENAKVCRQLWITRRDELASFCIRILIAVVVYVRFRSVESISKDLFLQNVEIFAKLEALTDLRAFR